MDDVKKTVREVYGRIAREGAGGSACCTQSSCCGPPASVDEVSGGLGYAAADLAEAPAGSNLGLGCGNPQAIASLSPGETVLDLGSGGGLDCFLAARGVGETGKAIGVDMTPDMVSRARENAHRAGIANVEFRLGEIEHLPVANDCVDVIISNCVINLSPDKQSVFREAFRVLREGGRLAVSDVVATAELPAEIRADLQLHAGCVAGASSIPELEAMIGAAGFRDVRVSIADRSREIVGTWMPERRPEEYIASATIEATKP